ncbi:MAG: COX15/CtaA family protein [Acidimicrobiales bacterium]
MTGSADQLRAWGRSLQTWTRVTLVWLMAITVTGAVVRLTGSGLGCTDWPTCSVNTELDAPAFHSAIEFGNRVISGLAIIPVIAAWIAARRGRPDLIPWLMAMIAGFVGQVLLGMLVTRTELDPRVVLGHFLLSIVLIFIGVVLDVRARQTEIENPLSGARSSAFAMLVITSVLVVVGTLVTGSGPHTGSDESGEAIARLGFDIREVTRFHSLIAWALVAMILWSLWRARNEPAESTKGLRVIAGIAVAQGGIGYLQYFLGVPEFLVGLHIAGSVLLWTAVATHWVRTASRPGREVQMAPAPSEVPA